MGIFDRLLKGKKTGTKKSATGKTLVAKSEVKEVKTVTKEAAKDIKTKPVTEKLSTLKPKTEVSSSEAVKDSKVHGVKKTDAYLAFRILIKPLVTEKATNLVSQNKYAFKVASHANKVTIKKAIRGLYGFDPVAVNIINERGPRVTYGRIRGKKSNWKKAIVTLKPGEKIEIYEGV